MTHSALDAAKVEVLKVWYSVFCTLVDAKRDGEYTDVDFIEKMMRLRTELAERIPEVEQMMRQEQTVREHDQ